LRAGLTVMDLLSLMTPKNDAAIRRYFEMYNIPQLSL